jgi:mono/diheme cytochrome c family protein
MTASRWLAAMVSALALVAAGCGGDDESDSGGSSTPATSAGGAPDGKMLFSNTCGGCHTLKAAGTSGTTGPNLDELKPDVDRVKKAIAEGPSIMPENLYEGADADAVAKFVADNAGS